MCLYFDTDELRCISIIPEVVLIKALLDYILDTDDRNFVQFNDICDHICVVVPLLGATISLIGLVLRARL